MPKRSASRQKAIREAIREAMQEVERNKELVKHVIDERCDAFYPKHPKPGKEARMVALLKKRTRLHMMRRITSAQCSRGNNRVASYLPLLDEEQASAFGELSEEMQHSGRTTLQIAARITLRRVNERVRRIRRLARRAKKR